MRTRMLMVGAVVAAIACLTGCGGGGNGADFDETLYYSKQEIDGFLNAIYTMTEADAAFAGVDTVYTKEEIDAVLPAHGGNSAIQLSTATNSYATGVPFTVPDGARFVIVSATATDPATAEFNIYVANDAAGTGWNGAVMPKESSATHLLILNVWGLTSARMWCGGDSNDVDVDTSIWFKFPE